MLYHKKRGATHYHVLLGLPEKGSSIKGCLEGMRSKAFEPDKTYFLLLNLYNSYEMK